jgi:hypothetical protein
MKMASMEKSQVQKVENQAVACEPEKYPYGLRIHLDHETVKKLGLKTLPGVKQKFYIEAMAEVCDVHAHESEGEERISIGLQICEMGMEPEKKMSASTLYEEK